MAMDFSKAKGTNNMLKSIQAKSAEQSGSLVAINIPLDQIDENPENEQIFNMDGIDTLAEGIKADGFLGAISVLKKPDGRYEISSGHRRYRAMKLLGRKTIPCIVSPYPDDDVERILRLISSNIRNRELTPLDWARTIDRYMKAIKQRGDKGIIRDLAAEYFKMAPTNIQRYVSLLKLIPELQELANDPEYSYSAFTTAATLDKELQYKLYDQIQDELEVIGRNKSNVKALTRPRIEQMINALKDKPDNEPQKNKSVGNFVTKAVDETDEDGIDETADSIDMSGDTPDEQLPEIEAGAGEDDAEINTNIEDLPDVGDDATDYYTAFTKGNPLKNGGLTPRTDDDMEEFIPTPSAVKAPVEERLTRCINEVEEIVSADVEAEKRETVRAKVEILESLMKKLKEKYVL